MSPSGKNGWANAGWANAGWANAGWAQDGTHRLTENGVPPSGNTRAVVSQSVAGRAPGVVRSKWRE